MAVVLMLGFVATGATIFTCQTAAGQDDKKPTAEKPVEPAPRQEKEKEKEAFTAWGKEVGGLQAGLGYKLGQKRAYFQGETVRLVVRVRNVSKEGIQFRYLQAFFVESPPTVTDAAGKPLRVEGFSHVEGKQGPKRVNLAPGKEIELYELKFKLRPDSKDRQLLGEYPYWNTLLPGAFWGVGKVRFQFERLASPDTDKTLSKLATGKLELEIKSGPPPAAANAETQAADELAVDNPIIALKDATIDHVDDRGRTVSFGFGE
jgi:hypothetical protein